MARKPIHIIHCDRCGDEIGRAEIPADEKEDAPAYFRQVVRLDGDKPRVDEKALTHLCERCKKEVEKLDERIFSDSRVRKGKADGENENKEKGEANAGSDAGSS